MANNTGFKESGTGARQTIVCMKWGTQYGPEYVNRLYGMVSRHLTRPFRLICLTDDETGIRSEVQRYPIPSIPVPEGGPERCWRKLASFSPEIAPILGDRALYLDLDIVLVGSVDVFFDHPGDFLIIRDWYHPLFSIGNSSVYRFRPERSTDVFAHYCRNHARISGKYRNEQEYLTRYMRDFGALGFWPTSWCRSFKHDCIPPWPINRWREPRLPDQSRIIVFHGHPKPPDAIVGGPAFQRALAHRPASWVEAFWHDSEGTAQGHLRTDGSERVSCRPS